MRKLILLMLWLVTVTVQAQPLKARVKIDAERKIGTIDKNLYGNFTEHLGRCIYGGIYEPTSPEANGEGFRKDVITATRDLGVSVVRWPGGNFVSGYHWQDGIGPKADRPKRKDLAWGDVEPNTVGTDEFLRFAQSAGVEPYLCVNMGTGTLDEARNWVEYCNAPTGLYYSDLRARNGHPAPYKVKYWGLGNEMDGEWQIGHKNAEDYSKFALEAAKMMKWADDSIKLIASGSSNYVRDWAEWDRTVLNAMHEYIDYISLHHYANNHDKNHNKFMAATVPVENSIRITEGIINEVRSKYKMKKPIYIAFDEYNVWYRAWNDQKLEEHYNMQDALVVALYLNVFVRNAHIVKMANMAQLVNVIAPMMITGGKLWRQPIYFPLQLFAQNCQGQSLQTYVQCDTYDVDNLKRVPYLDVTSVYNDKTQELIINVVNRHETKSIETALSNQYGKLAGKMQVMEVNSTNLMDENNEQEQKVKSTSREMSVGGDTFTYTFPAHSFTQLKVNIKL
ncbi:MAG TPA: alpha-L-arabinofuranosidase C-terminal domain-containing protein [Cyclobacteriaceae bacterium]|nr:alpha-N-arabinofuranosidase [Cytophagales bacterium]HNP78007.1 alpha-L-arabinofuranosidase C-terminal domain-containing protein [Cyclobacteriaceae bacterium]